jgi:hypothetical protein
MQFDYLPQQTFHDVTKKKYLQPHDQDVFELQYFHANLVMPFLYVHYLKLKPIQPPICKCNTVVIIYEFLQDVIIIQTLYTTI